MAATDPTYSLENPFAPPPAPAGPVHSGGSVYDAALALGQELL